MPETEIQVKVKLFAIYQEAFAASELNLMVPATATAGSVLAILIEKKPELARWQEVTRFGVNLQFVEADASLKNEDEVVLIPPVSGG